MKNKPLDRSSRRLWFVSKLRQTLLLRNHSAPVICVVVVEIRREGREETEEWRELAICVVVVEVRREGREEGGCGGCEPASVRAGCGGSA